MATLERGSVAFGGYSVVNAQSQDAYFGKLDKNGRGLPGCDQVNPLDGDLVPDNLTVSFDAPTRAADSDAVVSTGTLTVDGSPNTVDEVLCSR